MIKKMDTGEPPHLDFSIIIAGSVHDMKNSLQMLLGTLDEVVDEFPVEQPSHAKLLRVQAEGRRINDQLVQLLTLYKAGNTQQNLQINEHDVTEFFEEIQLENRELLALRGIELNIECEALLQWFFDRELLKSVINNMLTNAQQHTRNKILLRAAIKEKQLLLSVDDNGPGYPDKMLKHYRNGAEVTPGSNTIETGGTGLGLYFSATIARMHRNRERQGYLQTSNEGIDGGARCAITLP